jgi:hypothetical protein
MTGQEVIDLIRNNGNLDEECCIQDSNGNIVDIKDVTTAIKRDQFDGDFDKSVSVIVLYDNSYIVTE